VSLAEHREAPQTRQTDNATGFARTGRDGGFAKRQPVLVNGCKAIMVNARLTRRRAAGGRVAERARTGASE
jgi:hypothetical protein